MANTYAHAVIGYTNSKHKRAPVVGNTKPEQLNFQRLSVDKNNAWNQAHERPQKRQRPLKMPKITTYQQLFAFLSAVMIVGEHVVDAQEKIGAQSHPANPPPHGAFEYGPEPDGDTKANEQRNANHYADDAPVFDPAGTSRSSYTGTADGLLKILHANSGHSELQGSNAALNMTVERQKRSNDDNRRKQKRKKYIVGRATSTIDPSRQSTCMSVVENVIQRFITRADLGKFVMREAGQDPMKMHTTRQIGGHSDLGSENITGIDVYIMAQKRSWVLSDNMSAEIKALPDLDELFHDMTDSIREQAFETMRQSVNSTLIAKYGWRSVLGVGDHSVRDITLNEPTSFLGIHTGWSSVATSPVAYVLEYEDLLLKKSAFAIAAGHCDLVIPLPADRPGQIDFIRKNAHLFFNPELKLNGDDYGTKFTISIDEDRRYTFIESAIEAIATSLSTRMVNAIKNDAFGETKREKMINLLQWHFPFYSAWIAYNKREYTEAGVRAVLDAIALAGGPFASGMKNMGIALKSGTLQRAGNTLSKLSWLDVPGKMDQAKVFIPVKGANWFGGPAAKWFAKTGLGEYNQLPDTGALNQLVDGAYAGRKTDSNNMEGFRQRGNT